MGHLWCGGRVLAVFLLGAFTRRGVSRAIWGSLIANAVVVFWILLSHRGILPTRCRWSLALYYIAIVGNLTTIETSSKAQGLCN